MRPVIVALKSLCVLGTLTLAVPTLAGHSSASAEPLRMAVAANFRSAAELLVREYRRAGGVDVQISSASTGILATQWRRGAPFDLLLAADQTRPQALVKENLTRGKAHCYAEGSLVLLGAQDLETALASPTLSIAIANPRSAPYGSAAREVLERQEFAGPDERRVVMGANVQQTYQFWHSGAADLALVARSLDPGTGIAVPDDWHAPIRQYAVINARSRRADEAQNLLRFILGEEAQRLLSQQGYRACG